MSEFLTNLVAVLGSLMTLLLTMLKSDLGKIIIQRVKGEAAQRALLTLNDTAFAIVAKHQQTTISALKEKAKSGQLDKEALKGELMKVKVDAQAEFAALARGGLSHCLDLLGVEAKDAPAFLDTLLESSIHKLKNGKESGLSLPSNGAPSSTWATTTIPPAA